MKWFAFSLLAGSAAGLVLVLTTLESYWGDDGYWWQRDVGVLVYAFAYCSILGAFASAAAGLPSLIAIQSNGARLAFIAILGLRFTSTALVALLVLLMHGGLTALSIAYLIVASGYLLACVVLDRFWWSSRRASTHA